jgi:hypothetical protein
VEIRDLDPAAYVEIIEGSAMNSPVAILVTNGTAQGQIRAHRQLHGEFN